MKIKTKITDVGEVLRLVEISWYHGVGYADAFQIFVEINNKEIFLREVREKILKKKRITLKLYAITGGDKYFCILEIIKLKSGAIINVKECDNKVVFRKFKGKLERYLKIF